MIMIFPWFESEQLSLDPIIKIFHFIVFNSFHSYIPNIFHKITKHILGEVTIVHRSIPPGKAFPAFPQQPLRRQGEADVSVRDVSVRDVRAWCLKMEFLMGKTWEHHWKIWEKPQGTSWQEMGNTLENHRKICGKLRKHLYTCRFW